MINFYNGNFIVYEKSKFVLIKGSMQVENGVVLSFNKTYKNLGESIDLKGKLVTPIFINAHLHLGEYFFKFGTQMPIKKYLEITESINTELADNKDLIWKDSAEETFKENLKYGNLVVSTIRGDIVLSNHNIKSYVGYPIMQSEKLKRFSSGGIKMFIDFCDNCKKSSITPGVFFHSFYANDFKSFLFAKECNNLSKTFFAVHVAEDDESERIVKKKFKMRSISVLKKHDLLNENTLIVHGCALNKKELKEISNKKANIVICPISNANISNGMLNPEYLLEHNINWCIASDGLGTGETANLLEQAKVLKINYPKISFIDLFKAITINPAKALKCEKEVLAINSKCKFLVFDCKETDSLEMYLFSLFCKRPNLCYTYNNAKEQR